MEDTVQLNSQLELQTISTTDNGTNQFGKTSELSLRAVKKDKKTILSDVYFTAPYKIMHPFPLSDGGIQVMLLSASAGIMEGDRQEFKFTVETKAKLEFISQSYDKIHQMVSGYAQRYTSVQVAENATFRFNPQPTIPFKDSAFKNIMDIHLADETASFQMTEIFSCGRYARHEEFAYRFYHNLVKIYRAGKLIYRDNTRFDPKIFDMAGMGMYESYTHQANIFITKPQDGTDFAQKVRDLLDSKQDKRIEGSITRISSGDFAIRIFGHRAQHLEELNKEIYALL